MDTYVQCKQTQKESCPCTHNKRTKLKFKVFLVFFQRIEFASPATGAQPVVATLHTPIPPSIHLSRPRAWNESYVTQLRARLQFFLVFVLRSKYQQIKMASENQTEIRAESSEQLHPIFDLPAWSCCIWHRLHLSTVSSNWEQAIKNPRETLPSCGLIRLGVLARLLWLMVAPTRPAVPR